MKALLLALIAASLFIAGCTLPWEQKQPGANDTTQIAQAPKNGTNATLPAQNETVIRKNYTVIKPPERPDPFAGLPPRNASDRIGDGLFRINDMPAAMLNIYVISDGYADSILVNKGQFNMLVDSGSSAETLGFLRNQGVMRLNVVVATRDDPGAIGGLSDVLDAYSVDEFWDNHVQSNPSLVALVPPSTAYAELLQKVKDGNITVKHPQAGDNLSVSGMDVSVLNPQSPRLKGNPDVDAIVMKVSFNNFCALLLNPTVQERESALMGTGGDLDCPVMTYFKHGEGRPEPSLLLTNYPPKDVIISVGGNADGLPSQTTLTRLKMQGITVWRTDVDGTLRVYSDGYSPYAIKKVK